MNDTIREMQRIRAAEAPVVGTVLAMDSEFDVYAEALKRLGIATTGLQNSAAAAKSAFAMATRKSVHPRRIATDAASEAEFAKRFPNAGRLKQRGAF